MANTLTFANQTITDAHIFGGISFTHDLNTGKEFSIGNTASASVTFVTDIQLPLYTKDAVNGTFTWTRDSVSRGRYYITEVTKQQGKYTVTAYDAMILADTGISVLNLSFPLTVSALATAIATYLGCTVSGTVNNGSISVSSLDESLTVRRLLGYVAEASGCSVKIDGAGHLCFMYYASSGITVAASQYKELEVADYTCAAIDNVQIFDVAGMVCATYGSGTNTLFIQGNPLLYEATNTEAQVIYSKVSGFAYAPLRCDMFEENGLEVGTTATFGSTSTLVMHIDSSETGATVSSVGSDSRAELNKSIEVIVNEAKAAADNAQATANALNQHFWYTSSGAEAGAHIAEIPKATFDVTPSGGNLKANSQGIKVREGLNDLATFGATGMKILGNNGTVEIANLGYGESNSGSGTSTKPYYTLGERITTTTAYDSTATYSIGDLCVYNNKVYCCKTAITTAEAWNSSHWQLAVGNYSVAEGLSLASGQYSHTEGVRSYAVGGISHVEGADNMAAGRASHAEGEFTQALASRSHTQGQGTIAQAINQTVIGKYNVAQGQPNSDGPDDYALIIGNGSSDSARANALAVVKKGDLRLKGDVYVGCNDDSTGGTKLTSGGGGGGSGETYSLSISGHTITLSGDGGTTSSVTVPDNNTTYTLSISDHTLTLTPSTGSPQTVTVPDDNTTYTLTRDGNNITLTPSSGTAQSIVATYYATCSTAAATSKKEVTVDSSFSLESGARIVVYMTNSNTVSNPTLSVNGGTAHAIRRYGTTAAGTSAAAGWNAGQMLSMTYSGSYWYIENWINTTYSTITDAEYQAGTSTSSRLVTPARLKNAILYHAPVKSVNGQTGTVTVSVPTKTSELTNDSGFLNSVPEADEITFSSSGHWNFFQNVTDVSQALDVIGDYIDDNLDPLIGTTADVTPQDVMTALGAGRDICITASYTYQSIPLALRFTAFNRATDTVSGQVLDYAVSQTIVGVGGDTVLFTLIGGTYQGAAVAWQVNMQVLVNDSTLGLALNGYVPTSREVNNKPLSTNITLTSSDVGAISAPSSASAGDFLVYNGSAWVAQSLSTWQGGNY